VPGETAAPGTTTGKTSTPSPENVGISFMATVNAVDSSWNLLTNVTDNVGITSSDVTATLPPSAGLVSGTQSFQVVFNSSGSFTVTASDLSDGTKTANTSPAISVGTAQFTPATGGSAIPADLA